MDDIFWIDYGDDEEFMRKVSGNFLELITVDQIVEMMNDGYKYMQSKHASKEIPLVPRLNNAIFDKRNLISNIAKVPNAIRSINIPGFIQRGSFPRPLL